MIVLAYYYAFAFSLLGCNNIGLVVFEKLAAVWCTLNDSNPPEPYKRIGLVATVEPSVCARD